MGEFTSESYQGMSETKASARPVDAALSDLEKSTHVVDKAVMELCQRLEPVLRQVEDRDAVDVPSRLSAVRPGTSTVATAIGEQVDRLESLADRVGRAIQRLEI